MSLTIIRNFIYNKLTVDSNVISNGKIGIRLFSTTIPLRLDPSSYTALAFATNKSVIPFVSPFYLLALGLASTLYIMLIRVSPESAISGNLEHVANLVELAERLDQTLMNFISKVQILNHHYMNNPGNILLFDEMRSLYDTLCQVYTTTSGIFDAFESAYEILNELGSDDGLEYVNRLVEVRNNITLRCNDILRLMRSIENYTLGYDFFTNRMPNFWLS